MVNWDLNLMVVRGNIEDVRAAIHCSDFVIARMIQTDNEDDQEFVLACTRPTYGRAVEPVIDDGNVRLQKIVHREDSRYSDKSEPAQAIASLIAISPSELKIVCVEDMYISVNMVMTVPSSMMVLHNIGENWSSYQHRCHTKDWDDKTMVIHDPSFRYMNVYRFRMERTNWLEWSRRVVEAVIIADHM